MQAEGRNWQSAEQKLESLKMGKLLRKTSETQSWFFSQINENDKPLAIML